ncbi:iron-containing alcohol dehydrogenase family protein [Streptococcus sobrinus]|uniref:Glycerol dehydrogenase n=1 Tax=Streptococcus sobrinus W1703 TaxID=1227275 RepID=U2IJC7_9STRE|nr:iron-containing alcohol dehydrogenase family protein [Streptococcus sobrinus]ERJ73996.1 3-dehydroquinate synthase [Streptococcus sobrinus W1703]
MTEHLIRLSPAEYINQVGILKKLPEIIKQHGYQNPVVLTDTTVREIIPDYLPDNFLDNYPLSLFSGNATKKEIKRLTGLLKGYDLILAFGGGQLMDTAKVVADNLRIALINIPTLPSNCAALTTKSILYSEQGHEMIGAHRQSQAVTMVLLEPKLLQNAPEPYVLSGIGDTLAKFYEIRLRLTDNKLDLVTAAISRQYLDICRDEILKVGDYRELDRTQLINFLDTIFLIAASVDGLANLDGRSVLAHAFYNAYMKYQTGKKKTHGEVVALGNLFQLHLEGNQVELLKELEDYHQRIGLPLTIKDIYLDSQYLEDMANYIAQPDNIRVQTIFPNINSQEILSALEKLEI